MRRLVRLCALSAWVLCGWAEASPNDFLIYQLGNPTPGGPAYTPAADANFRAFAREMGAAITSTILEPPNSLGVDGFAFNAELSVVNFHNNNTTFILPTEQPFQGPLLMPSLHVRKGLPFSFELGARVAYLDKSSMAVATGEVKWALSEGVSPYLPVLGLRLFVSRLFNTQDFDLTAGGLDFGLGKRFAIGGMVTITPYAGYVLSFAAANSGFVDFARASSAASTEATPLAVFNNTGQYAQVVWNQNLFSRIYGGFRFIAGVVQLGAELSYGIPGAFTQPASGGGAGINRSLPNELSANSTIGLDF